MKKSIHLISFIQLFFYFFSFAGPSKGNNKGMSCAGFLLPKNNSKNIFNQEKYHVMTVKVLYDTVIQDVLEEFLNRYNYNKELQKDIRLKIVTSPFYNFHFKKKKNNNNYLGEKNNDDNAEFKQMNQFMEKFNAVAQGVVMKYNLLNGFKKKEEVKSK